MSLSAKQLFPGWYKRAGYETDAATLKTRTDAIEKMIAKEDGEEFWQDLVKVFLNIRVPSADINPFVGYFVEEDPAFPITDNQNIIRTLARKNYY